MSEIKNEIKENADGSFTITDAHSTADIVRWLLTQDSKETILYLLDEALAQPEQDKARCVGCDACIDTACGRDECPKGWPKAAQPEQEPEFVTHNVDKPYDWSEWVCPNPSGYLMKCCDCGLVHEAEFGVVRYKSETEREDCDMVDDPNLQAVFRMRRSEKWSPEDTAHRAGGLPMAQPEQEPDLGGVGVFYPTEQEPVAWGFQNSAITGSNRWMMLREEIPANDQYGGALWTPLYTTPPQRKPLTEWQPIDTAPKGKLGYSWMLLAWGPEEDKNVCYGMRHEDKFYAAPSFYCLNQERKYQQREIEINPTHWMPVPNAPIEAANGIKE